MFWVLPDIASLAVGVGVGVGEGVDVAVGVAVAVGLVVTVGVKLGLIVGLERGGRSSWVTSSSEALSWLLPHPAIKITKKRATVSLLISGNGIRIRR